MCYADYIDRVTFQNQIWQFNEISSLIKTFYNNKKFHDFFRGNHTIDKPTLDKHTLDKHKLVKITNVRFTKVLTKYSTEYNNIIFVYMLCQELDMDRKDMISFFQEMRMAYGGVDFNANSEKLNEVENIFADTEINKLDIKRMYRYLDKNVKKDKNTAIEEEYDIEDE
jgi:hypothetical protein